MANNKQQMKRDITNNKRNALKSSFDSSVKTAMKALEEAIKAGNKEDAVAKYQFLCKKLDKSISKGVHNKNYVARQKSRFAKMINQMA